MNQTPVMPTTEASSPATTNPATLPSPDLAHGDVRGTYTVEEAAAVLGISRGSAYAAVNRGEIPSVRINRRLLVPRERLRQFLNSAPVYAKP